MTSKKIAFLLPSLWGGGAEKVASKLANKLSKIDNLSVDIICLESGIKYDLSEKINYYTLSHLNYTDSIYKKFLFFPFQFSKLLKIFKKRNYRTVINFLNRPLSLIFVYSLFSLLPFKLIISHRNYMSKELSDRSTFFNFILNGFIYRKVIKSTSKIANNIIVNSESSKLDLIENFNIQKEKIECIYNPFDNSIPSIGVEHKKLNSKFGSIFDKKTIVTMGSLKNQKGHEHLLRAFSKSKELYRNSRLLILGEGSNISRLLLLSKNLNLKTYSYDNFQSTIHGKDVYFLGFQENFAYFLQKSDIYVFPSLWEGFPNALVEAMYFSLPIISSDCKSGPREILAPRTSIRHQTKFAELSDFGILLPPPKIKMLEHKREYLEQLWSKSIQKLLFSSKILEYYGTKSKHRYNQLSNMNTYDRWKDLTLYSERA